MTRKHRLIERAELVFDVFRQVHAGGYLYGAVISGLDATITGEGIDIQLLRTGGVYHAEADRQHEFRMLVGDLDGPQFGETETLLFCDVDFRDEESHALLEVTAYYRLGAVRDPIVVVSQPSNEAVALFGRQGTVVLFGKTCSRLKNLPSLEM